MGRPICSAKNARVCAVSNDAEPRKTRGRKPQAQPKVQQPLSVEESRKAVRSMMTERELQKLCVEWLRRNGYTVMETGIWDISGRNTEGCPDLYVWHPSWQRWSKPRTFADSLVRAEDPIPGSGWMGIELKRPGEGPKRGKVRDEQKRLAALDATVICTTLEEVIAAVTA